MTLNLKLVRHQDGKWTALNPESDELTRVSVKEKKCAPIDPACLLKALDSVLSPACGIRSIEDVPRMASLMKKFSKKLVSRCVYCNVLQATEPQILSEFLDKGGWETINTWLSYAKSNTSDSFMLELLRLCKLLPMTLDRLKENNTAKVIKSLTKHENSDVKSLSSDLVSKWMGIIKEKKGESVPTDKKKKKEKVTKPEKAAPVKEETKSSPKHTPESPKLPLKLKGLKRSSVETEFKKVDDIYEDVKIDPEPLMPISKKPRTDRPKTAKIYQKKFRATGLEEITPLPKNISKKTATIDKNALAVAKNALKLNPTTTAERVTEKKLKPESLMTVSENTKGIKVIPAKPRPTYVLHESASFMDALISQPTVPIKRKKKVHKSASPTTTSSPTTNAPSSSSSPTSPTIPPPKLQFYKDTLEMNDENKKEESENKNDDVSSAENKENTGDENVPMDTTEEGGQTPPNEETMETSSPSNNFDPKDADQPKAPFDPNNLKSILSHGRRRGKKKIVHWVEDENIKEVFYFELDDTERENVSRNSSFYDMKSIEMKREREAMELAKRGGGEKVEVFGRWWDMPILVDCPPPPIEPGSNSTEKLTEVLRQQSTLQEIYFTREMIPDTPHEPDLEIHPPKEPIIIPFDESNVISAVNDFSNYKIHKVTNLVLPDILASLIKVTTSQPPVVTSQSLEPSQVSNSLPSLQPPHIKVEPMTPDNVPMSINQPYEPGPEPVIAPPHLSNGLLGPVPLPPFNQPPPKPMGMELPPGEWRTLQDLTPPEQYFGGFPPVNQNMPPNQLPPHLVGNIRPHGGNMRPNFRGMGSRPPRTRTICRHFANGHCRFGAKCSFLHPGVNGPPLL